MGRFFNMDNKFFVFMGKIADLCMLNLLCIICCIPIVTAGASDLHCLLPSGYHCWRIHYRHVLCDDEDGS